MNKIFPNILISFFVFVFVFCGVVVVVVVLGGGSAGEGHLSSLLPLQKETHTENVHVFLYVILN